jgi:hypothetical protein
MLLMDIPRFYLRESTGEAIQDAQSLGLSTLRQAGGSVVVTIPSNVLDRTNMAVDDAVVIHVSEDSISLTKLSEETQTDAP